jgi:hypothetical protein
MGRSLEIVVQEYLDLARQQDEIAEAMLLLRERLEALLYKEDGQKYQCEVGTFSLVPSPTKVEAKVDPTMLPRMFQKITADQVALRKALELGLDVPARLIHPEKPFTLRVQLKKEP